MSISVDCDGHSGGRHPPGLSLSPTLSVLKLAPGQTWPCDSLSDRYGYSHFHYPRTVPGHCRQAIAVYCEQPTQIGFLRYCAWNRCVNQPIIAVDLEKGMNIIVSCSDNIGGMHPLFYAFTSLFLAPSYFS